MPSRGRECTRPLEVFFWTQRPISHAPTLWLFVRTVAALFIPWKRFSNSDNEATKWNVFELFTLIFTAWGTSKKCLVGEENAQDRWKISSGPSVPSVMHPHFGCLCVQLQHFSYLGNVFQAAMMRQLNGRFFLDPASHRSCTHTLQGTHGTGKAGKTGKMDKKNPCLWKICLNTGNFVCSSCKFSDSEGKGYCDICRGNFFFS